MGQLAINDKVPNGVCVWCRDDGKGRKCEEDGYDFVEGCCVYVCVYGWCVRACLRMLCVYVFVFVHVNGDVPRGGGGYFLFLLIHFDIAATFVNERGIGRIFLAGEVC